MTIQLIIIIKLNEIKSNFKQRQGKGQSVARTHRIDYIMKICVLLGLFQIILVKKNPKQTIVFKPRYKNSY